jgi:chaperonin GroEL
MDNNNLTLGKQSTEIIRSRDALGKLFEGLKITADVVGSTMGPSGKNVIIRDAEGNIVVTRDGITVANSVQLSDKIMSVGSDLVKQAAQKTNDEVGDGTTSTTVLTRGMVQEGLKLLATGYEAGKLIDELEEAVQEVCENLDNLSYKVSSIEDLKKVARISANNDEEIANIVSEAVFKCGQEGIINVEQGRSIKTTLEFSEGISFNCGFLSSYFITDSNRASTVFENCHILISDEKISSLKSLIPILEDVHKNRTSLLIIAEDIEGDALQGLVLNRMKTGLNIVAVKSPYYGKRRQEFLEDIAILTNATVFSSATHQSLEKCKIDICGKAKKIVVDAKTTTIIHDVDKQKLESRKELLRNTISDPTTSSDESEFLKERLAKLSDGVALIKVGGITEVETKERMFRIEDAVNATKTAFKSGVLPGGGIALIRASKNLKAKFGGFHVVKNACDSPLKQICENCNKSYEVVAEKIFNMNDTFGFDARNGVFKDMIDGGIIDPLNVTRNALLNAASVAKIFLSLDSVIV